MRDDNLFASDALAHDPNRGIALARVGFTLAAIALGAQTADLALHVYVRLATDRPFFALLNRPEYSWYVGTPITWGAAVASCLLLLGTPPGRARVGALALATMNTFDIALWLAEHATELRLTLPLDLLGDPWIAHGVRVLQWFELLLFTELAAGTLQRISPGESHPARQGVRATGSLGLIVWTLAFALRTVWMFGLFGRLDPRIVGEILLLDLASAILLTATAFQATVLCATTARNAAQALRQPRKSSSDDDLLRTHDRFD